ncbi:MAG TPA: PKD domain-containing protein [Solirubrobacteraceae bacterium]
MIYWDPKNEFTTTTKGIVDGFFSNVANDNGLPTNVFAVAGQYTDLTGHAAYSSTSTVSRTDSEKYPTGKCAAPEGAFADTETFYTNCMVDEQLQEELSRFIAAEELPVGPTQLYFVLLPHNVATCLEENVEFEPGVFEQACSNNAFCAYHSYIEPGTANEIIYADIPFSLLDSVADTKGCQADGHSSIQQPNPDNASGSNTETRFADVALKYISHEYIEAITDPLVGEETAWVDNSPIHQEIGDKCNSTPNKAGETGLGIDANAFLPTLGGTALGKNLFNQSIGAGSYYLQSEWDNGGKACLMRPLALSGAFGSGAAIVGSPVSFSATSSDPYGGFEPTWTFGDGATATGPSPSHTFATPGGFTVTMTPRDALTGSTGVTVSRTIMVAPPSAPPGPSPPPSQPLVTSSSPVVATTQIVAPNSVFISNPGTFNPVTGAITFKATVSDAGTFSWLSTFQNGKFGAFASASKCRRGLIKLSGKCRPAKIVFASGSRAVAGAGTVTLTLKPSTSAVKALKNALRQKKGLPVSIVLSFQSARGGSPVSQALKLTVKLKK